MGACAVTTTFHGHFSFPFISPVLPNITALSSSILRQVVVVVVRVYFWFTLTFGVPIRGPKEMWPSLTSVPPEFARLFFKMARIIKHPEDESGFDALAILHFSSSIFT